MRRNVWVSSLREQWRQVAEYTGSLRRTPCAGWQQRRAEVEHMAHHVYETLFPGSVATGTSKTTQEALGASLASSLGLCPSGATRDASRALLGLPFLELAWPEPRGRLRHVYLTN